MTRYVANAVCPKCHRPPATRYYAGEIERAQKLAPEEPIHDVTCTRPGCGAVYVIAALCLQTATPVSALSGETLHLAKPRRAA